MGTDSGPVNGLEERKTGPGHWLIGGYDVTRARHETYYSVALSGGHVPGASFRSLAAVRAWIRDRVAETEKR
jgi:hypothetical protein